VEFEEAVRLDGENAAARRLLEQAKAVKERKEREARPGVE
jgi:hypothetical protein